MSSQREDIWFEIDKIFEAQWWVEGQGHVRSQGLQQQPTLATSLVALESWSALRMSQKASKCLWAWFLSSSPTKEAADPENKIWAIFILGKLKTKFDNCGDRGSLVASHKILQQII
jgi:hypothetical protein